MKKNYICKILIMNKTKKNYGQIIIIQRIVKARSKNYYENNKELLQEKAQITIWMKLLLRKQNGIVTSFFVVHSMKN